MWPNCLFTYFALPVSQQFFFTFTRKSIEIPIIEEDSYDKNVILYVAIGEPRHIAGKPTSAILKEIQPKATSATKYSSQI